MEHVFRRVQKLVFHPLDLDKGEIASFYFADSYSLRKLAEAMAAILDEKTPFSTMVGFNGGQQGVHRSIIVFRHPCTHFELDACRTILLALANIYGWQVEEV